MLNTDRDPGLNSKYGSASRKPTNTDPMRIGIGARLNFCFVSIYACLIKG